VRIFPAGNELRASGRQARRAGLSISAALLCAASLVAPAIAHARDLVVYGEPTLQRALKSIGSLWQARSGTRVNVFVAPTDLSYAQIDRGARCDVIFALAGAATEEAARNNIIQAATVERVLRNSLVLIGTEASAQSDKDASPADLARLIAGKRLAIANPDRDAAGTYAVGLLRKVGIVVDDRNKAAAVAESAAGVVDMLTTGKAQLGIVYATDATAGFKVVARLPVPDRPPLDYVMAQARDPASDTRPFMAFLKSAEARAAFESAGLTSIAASNGAADAGRQQ
jgi:molybdate transport system substrate-binding protein